MSRVRSAAVWSLLAMIENKRTSIEALRDLTECPSPIVKSWLAGEAEPDPRTRIRLQKKLGIAEEDWRHFVEVAGPDSTRRAHPTMAGRMLRKVLDRVGASRVAARVRATPELCWSWVRGESLPEFHCRKAMDHAYDIPAHAWTQPAEQAIEDAA